MNELQNWARRKGGRKSEESQPAAGQAPAAAMPANPPPPGYGYVAHPQYGMVLVPLSALDAAPGVPNMPPPVRPIGRLVPVDTCTLVKGGDKDPYAELLKGVPELVPNPGGWDAMAGNPNPATVEAFRGDALFSQSMHQMPPQAFTSAAHMPSKAAPLGK